MTASTTDRLHHNDATSDPSRLRATVRDHPLVSFFTAAYGLSWLGWLPYVLSDNGLGVWHVRFPVLLGSSEFAGVLPGAYAGPILAAFAVTALADGRAGLRRWLGRVGHWKVNWRWYAAALLGVPALMFAATLPFTAGHGGLSALRAPSAVVVLALVPGLLLQIVTTGLAEEPGWRDFALPRMQQRFGPMPGTLVLGVLWGCWHLPLFATEWAPGGWTASGPVIFVAAAVMLSVVMTWVFNRTRESLPVAVVVHTGVNNVMSIAWAAVFPAVPATFVPLILLTAFGIPAVILSVATRGRLGRGR